MRRSWWEAGAVALALAVLAAAIYGPNAIHGGFLSDAWANRAIYVFAPEDGFVGGVDRFLDEPNVAARPLYAVYLVALNTVFGSHMGFWLAWLGATSVLMSLSLYLLLRKLGLAFLDAGLISALVLIFPAADSLRFWAAVVQIPIAISFAAFGFLLALQAFDRKGVGGRGVALHCASLVCFVSSLLFYEAALAVMLASIFLYRLRVSWVPAATRWAVDVGVLVTVAIVVAGSASGAKDVQSLAGMWRHGIEIGSQAWTLLVTVVIPFAGTGWYVAALLALVPIAAAVIVMRLPPTDALGAQLRHWLTVGAGGFAVVVLGYAVFVPGIDYYAPMAPGIADRVNAVPSVGWVLILYALVMTAMTLAFRRRADARVLISVFATTACGLIGIGWVRQIDRDSDHYTQAFREGQRVLAAVRTAVPSPPPNSTIWTFGQPVEIASGIPLFGNTWDMTTAVQLMYDDSTIKSFVGFPGTTFECTRYSIVPGGNPSYPPGTAYQASEFSSAYDRSYFVDTVAGRWEAIRTPAQCRRAVASFKLSPALPPG